MELNLYQIFKDKWIHPNGTIWVISDTHFGDVDCYKMRHPVTFQQGTEYMHDSLVKCLDKEQIKNINSKCGKNDTLILLGDVGDIECVKKLKAKYKVLIMGNHDKGASNYKKLIKRTFTSTTTCEDGSQFYTIEEESNNLFDEVYEGPLMINDRLILSHEPIDVPEYMFNIHGHIHDEHSKGDDYHMNCCAEAINYTPVNLNKLLTKGLLKGIKDIHRVTIDDAINREEGSDVDTILEGKYFNVIKYKDGYLIVVHKKDMNGEDIHIIIASIDSKSFPRITLENFYFYFEEFKNDIISAGEEFEEFKNCSEFILNAMFDAKYGV